MQSHEDKQTMSDDGNDSLDDVMSNINAEKFKEASTSLFDDSSIFAKNSERSSSSDFMAHQVFILFNFFSTFTTLFRIRLII